MSLRTLVFAALIFSATAASAKSDLAVTMSAPSSTFVYDMARYDLTVSNNGPHRAKDVTLRIDLPETHTSPTVHVMGTVGDMSGACDLVDRAIICDLGSLRRDRSKAIYFEMEHPVQMPADAFEVLATTSSNETNPADNALSLTPSLEYYDTPISGPTHVTNRHCTGQGLTGFFECTVSPSSISSHGITLEADGTITFDNAPMGYTGTWTQVLDDRLQLAYYHLGTLTVAFHGYGVGGSCFEGLALFPTSSYNSAYEVCLD